MDASLSILERYLRTLDNHCSPATIRAARRDLNQFVAWWEQTHRRPIGKALLRDTDLRAWKHAREVADGMAPATINRAIAVLRGFGTWLVNEGITSEHPTRDLKDLPVDPPAPRAIPTEGIDALLRAVRAER